MLCISLNIRGLGKPSKILALRRLVDRLNSDLLLLNENLNSSYSFISILNPYLPIWDFHNPNTSGQSGDLLIRWNTRTMACITCWRYLLD